MRKERLAAVIVFGLMFNWMIHGEVWAVIYFGAVTAGLFAYYRTIRVEQMLETALVRFVALLGVCLCFSVELQAVEAAAYLMMCAASSALTQRLQSADAGFLDRLSMINMALMPVMMIVMLFCMQNSQAALTVMMMFPVLFQPSGLPVVSPLDVFDKSFSTK